MKDDTKEMTEIIETTGEENGNHFLGCILAWRIPWTEKPGGLQSMGSQKSGT